MDNVLKILFNGQQADGIRNLREIGFVLDFTQEISELELNIDTLVCTNFAKSLVEQHVEQYGFNVGLPVTIVYGTQSYDYYLDLSNKPKLSSREIHAKMKKRKGVDNFFDLANGTTFELQAKKGVVFNTVNIPYVIIPDNQAQTGLTLALGLFSTSVATLQAIRDLSYLATELSGAIASLNPALIATATLKFTIQLAYTTSLVITFISLAQKFFELIFPKLRYFKGMKVKELVAQSVGNLGYTFNSTLLDGLEGLAICPVPLVKGNKSWFKNEQKLLVDSFTKGYPTSSDTVPSAGALLSALEVKYNARVKVNNGNVRLERYDYYAGLSQLVQIPALNNQEKILDEYTVNSDEAVIRTVVRLQTDESDLHTLDNYEPTNAEYGNENINQITPELNLIKGIKEVDIPFALATRKNDLNWLEETAKLFFNAIDLITGNTINISSIISERIGVMQISQQFYSTTKIMYIDVNGRQPVNYLDYLSANSTYSDFYQIDEIAKRGFKEFENAPIKLNFDDFEQLLGNNFINVNDTAYEVRRLEFIPFKSKATINYRVPYNFAQGKINTFAINV